VSFNYVDRSQRANHYTMPPPCMHSSDFTNYVIVDNEMAIAILATLKISD